MNVGSTTGTYEEGVLLCLKHDSVQTCAVAVTTGPRWGNNASQQAGDLYLLWVLTCHQLANTDELTRRKLLICKTT